jgi:DNA polymerase III alpha subunit
LAAIQWSPVHPGSRNHREQRGLRRPYRISDTRCCYYLEDETGMSQAVVSPDLLQQHRKLIVGSPGLLVEGILQKRDGTISVKGEKFWSLKELVAVPSHDFR